MNVIVVGSGRVGSQLATMLSKRDHNVAIIDKDPSAFEHLGVDFNGITVTGIGFDEDTLLEAGIEECDAFAAVTNKDNANLMAAEVARNLFDVEHVVARLYSPSRERAYMQLGLDYVCDTKIVAEELLAKVVSGHSHHIDTFGDEIEIVDFVLNDKYESVKVSEIEKTYEVRIIGVARGDDTSMVTNESVLHPGDVVLAAIHEDEIDRIKKYMRR